MHGKVGRHLATLACFAALAGGTLLAQSITIAPTGYLTAGPGGTQQFTSVVSGLTGDMSGVVTWSAGGKIGGSATAGTIDANGLYTAPTVVPANAIQITVR